MKTDWQRHVLASHSYLELGMFDDAAMVLEEIALEDKTRNEVLGARVGIYMALRCCGVSEFATRGRWHDNRR